MSYLEIRNVTKRFDKQTALDNVSAGIEKGELVCILGPSGCGKTTLLRIVAGLEMANEGQIFIDGKDCTLAPARDRNFGIVFQSYALFPNMTVLGNIQFGLQQKRNMSKDDIRVKAHEVLQLVDLYDHKDKYPRQLSGGQQQRTALARAIALSPAYLLLDEPLSALDAKVRQKLQGEIKSIQKALGVTTIMVTHDQEEALAMADRIIVMNDAVVEQIGTPREIYDHPATPFVGGFVGAMNFYRHDGVACAIRPEKLEPVDRHDPHDLIVTVREVEFKGVLTRVYAATPENIEIRVDLSSDKADKLELHKNATMFLRTPQEYLSRWAV